MHIHLHPETPEELRELVQVTLLRGNERLVQDLVSDTRDHCSYCGQFGPQHGQQGANDLLAQATGIIHLHLPSNLEDIPIDSKKVPRCNNLGWFLQREFADWCAKQTWYTGKEKYLIFGFLRSSPHPARGIKTWYSTALIEEAHRYVKRHWQEPLTTAWKGEIGITAENHTDEELGQFLREGKTILHTIDGEVIVIQRRDHRN